MRKRLLYGLLAVVALVALFMVVKSCGKKPAVSLTKTAADSLTHKAGTAVKRVSKLAASGGAKGTHGSLQPMTPDQQAAEKKRLNDQKKSLKQELKRRRQEELLAGRAVRKRNAHAKSRSLYDAYTLKGTVAGVYALVGDRRLEKGDVVAGKEIVDIGSDRIVVEQFGTRFTIMLGQPVDPNLVIGRKKR